MPSRVFLVSSIAFWSHKQREQAETIFLFDAQAPRFVAADLLDRLVGGGELFGWRTTQADDSVAYCAADAEMRSIGVILRLDAITADQRICLHNTEEVVNRLFWLHVIQDVLVRFQSLARGNLTGGLTIEAAIAMILEDGKVLLRYNTGAAHRLGKMSILIGHLIAQDHP